MRTNFLFFIQAYNDQCPTSTPALSNFMWSREINGVPYNIENSQQIQVPTSSTSPNLILSACSFVYLESDQQISLIYNGGTAMTLAPFQINGKTVPGVFFINGPVTSLTVTNSGTAAANVFFACMD